LLELDAYKTCQIKQIGGRHSPMNILFNLITPKSSTFQAF